MREQMALADAVKQETSREQRSGVDRLLEELDETRSAELRAFQTDETVPSTALARAIAREYGKVQGTSDSQIRRWRADNL